LDLARKREPSINRATVYRTIELLKRLRLIDELDLMHIEGDKHCYEIRTEGDHIHLACFGWGMIQQFTIPLFDRLKEEVACNIGFEIRVARLELGGFCRKCSSRRNGEEGAKIATTVKR
jgi:Fur family transcriptional regulator, ferric uptake regulator